MNLQSYIKQLRKYGKRAFTIEEILEEFKVSPNYARVALHRLFQSGDLISPAKSFYVIVPPEYQTYGCIPAEQLIPILMKHLNIDYYVAMLSAGLFYGATHQKPARFQVMLNKRMNRNLVFGEVEIEFIYKKSIFELPTKDFVVDTGYLKVATPELTAIDLLNYPIHAGGLNHIATVFSELAEAIDAHKLIELAEKINARYQLQRIGYILEQIDVMYEDKKAKIIDALEVFLKGKMKYYIPIASEISKAGYPRCKKWRIIENSEIESDL
jgi:predicted transcriptional regulator of viral defense system